MNFLKGLKILAVAGVLVIISLFSSCEQELTTIGDGVIGGEPFTTKTVTYDVFAFNKKIEAVQTNRLPIYQLGVFDDPIYGKTEARINSQVQLVTYNPVFGDSTQTKEDNSAVLENETIDSVVVYIPFFNGADSDGDGVPNALEVGDDILDPTNDSDFDGLANNVEVAGGTNPLKVDTDDDGILDAVDDTNAAPVFAEQVVLDSIYGNRDGAFTFKIEENTFFLRDLDPSSDFQNTEEYYSDQQFAPDFTNEVFYEGSNTISDIQTVLVTTEDDPDTTEEVETVRTAINPGLRVQLDQVGIDYFQRNILDKEGSSELLNSSNFNLFFRGINLSVTPADDNLLFLLNMANARIEVYYHYDATEDNVAVQKKSSFNISFLSGTAATGVIGNAVNTFVNDVYPTEIENSLNLTENSSRIYLKGGAGSYAEIKLFDEIDSEAEILINEIKANNWIINEANLVFYVDRDIVKEESIEPPRLYLYNAETNSPLYNVSTETNSADSPLGSYLIHDGILEESDGQGLKYTVRITEYLNSIIVENADNATLGLTITPDIRLFGTNNVRLSDNIEKILPASSILSPLGTVLFGSDFPDTEEKKLRLEISYTETN
jgi:hypothetical protein